MKVLINTVIEMVDYTEPLRRKSGELLTFPSREAARQYAKGLPGHYMASWQALPE